MIDIFDLRLIPKDEYRIATYRLKIITQHVYSRLYISQRDALIRRNKKRYIDKIKIFFEGSKSELERVERLKGKIGEETTGMIK